MRYALVLSSVALLLFPSTSVRAADNLKCDKTSLDRLATDIVKLSGKERKKANKQLKNARAALESGDTKKCQRLVDRISVGSSKPSAADVAKLPPAERPARPNIDAVVAQFVKEFNSKDAAALAFHYAEDAAAFPPGQARVEGRENIRKMWEQAIKSGASNFMLTTNEVEESGNLAFESGTFSLDGPGNNGTVAKSSGKYVVVWKKAVDGTWQMYRDIWNEDQPAKAD
jgi:ketosteroid isomerase-like protein